MLTETKVEDRIGIKGALRVVETEWRFVDRGALVVVELGPTGEQSCKPGHMCCRGGGGSNGGGSNGGGLRYVLKPRSRRVRC